MITLMASGLSGMRAAQAGIEQSAGRVARSVGGGPSDLAAELVGQRQDRLLFDANLRSVQTADRLLGSLLDTFA